MEISVGEAAKLLGGEVRGRDGVLCPGPGHSAIDRSLHVTFNDDWSFRVASYAGDDWKACRDYVSEKLGLPTWRSGERKAASGQDYSEIQVGGGSASERHFTYRSRDGSPHILVRRIDNGDGSKTFRQDHWAGSEWRAGLNGTERILYRLPELLAAPEATVWVVEGEKCADALSALGLVATTSPGGAGGWRDSFSLPLAGRHVVILPDNDEPGRKHAAMVEASVRPLAASVKILNLPGLPIKGDVVDWLDSGGSAEGLRHLILGGVASVASGAIQANGGCLDERELEWSDPSTLPRRPWLYGRALIRGQVSLLLAPGGAGKSSFTCTDAMAMATGRTLLHDEVWGGPLRVRLWNLEEPRDEMVRRLEAVRLHYDLGEPSGLFLTCGFDMALCVAEQTRDGVTIAQPLVPDLIASLRRQAIDVLIIDPFVSSHRVNENDNGAIDAVAKEWAKVAHASGCAIQLVHHTVKLHGVEATADSARGASSLVSAVRIARALNPMSTETATNYGLSEPWRYLRCDDAKANYSVKDAKGRWHYLESIELGNGDSVGIVTHWSLPSAMDGVTVAHLHEVVRRAGQGEYRESPQSPEWVGRMIADVLEADLDNPVGRNRVKASLRAWLESGALKVLERMDPSRHMRKYVEPGDPMCEAASGWEVS